MYPGQNDNKLAFFSLRNSMANTKQEEQNELSRTIR
jgi:hypothetical protein